MLRTKCATIGLAGALAALTLFCSPLRAQEGDWTSWLKAGTEYRLNPAWRLTGGLEWRTKDDLSRTDRWGLDVGAACTVLPFLRLGGAYELHCMNRGADGWKLRHRYYLDGLLSARWRQWKVSLRERLQHTFDRTDDEFCLRSRLKLAYAIPSCPWEPYVSVEMFNGLEGGERFGVKRMRYRGGFGFPIAGKWHGDLFYCRQWDTAASRNIVGLNCTYRF